MSFSSFYDILQTPEGTSCPKIKPRAKVISLVLELTKSMFTEEKNKLGTFSAPKQRMTNMPGPSTVSSQKRKQHSVKMN